MYNGLPLVKDCRISFVKMRPSQASETKRQDMAERWCFYVLFQLLSSHVSRRAVAWRDDAEADAGKTLEDLMFDF